MSDATPQHRQAWDLIPWVLNGTAAAAERALVMDHLQACADCRAEFDFQQQLQQGLALTEAAPGLDADRALEGFWQAAASSAPPVPPVPSRKAAPRRQRWLVAAVLVQAVGLAGLAALLALRADPAADYQVLSRPDLAASAATIRIAPAPGLQLGELRALLARSDLQIVQASADAGHLGLALAPGARFDQAQALQRLRAEPGILLAEPLQAGGR